MKKFVVSFLMIIAVVVLTFGGCAKSAPAPATTPVPAAPAAPAETPAVAPAEDSVAAEAPYAGLFTKPDGSPYRVQWLSDTMECI